MKEPKAINIIPGNFIPGAISQEGFLGADKRSVEEIIRADEIEMTRLGVSFEAAAAKLSRLLKEGKKGLGGRVIVDRSFTVMIEEARGSLPCPFEDARTAKNTAVITRMANNRALVVSDLSLHLLATHHFLQGRGSPLRLEPRELKDVLGL
jgi:hypothetical protein